MSNSLELDQVPYAYVERAGDAVEHVDANVSRSCLDLPEMERLVPVISASRRCEMPQRVRSARIREPMARFSVSLSCG